VIRRMAFRARRGVRRWSRVALDVLDPPPPPSTEVARASVRTVSAEQTPNPLAVRYGYEGPPVPPATVGDLEAIEGVVDVFAGDDFVTVIRAQHAPADRVHQAVAARLVTD